jgi:REP element-mobilizing transposase RayT
MALPRSKYVQEGKEGVYHCYSRCVRRAFLYGFDALTRRDFSHRKAWLVDRLRHLAAIFAIDVCAYAVMENHYHTILRTRPDLVAGWSDLEVATRWLTLFPRQCRLKCAKIQGDEEQIRALANCPERIAALRQRLCSLSWFMGRLNEFIARAANREDKVKGRFWEARFKCQALLDDAATVACMVYVDLNPIRAGLAATPEESQFTSIQERISQWQKEALTTAPAPTEATTDFHASSFCSDRIIPKNAGQIPVPVAISTISNFLDDPPIPGGWLCPISSKCQRRGIIQMTEAEYFNLVDKSGRLIRSDKRSAIDSDLAPILQRIGANANAWPETVSRFGCKFHLAAGLISSLRNFADLLGRQWFSGISEAGTAFATSRAQ